MSRYEQKRFEEYRVGDRAEFTKTILAGDVEDFARISGDRHPAHFDAGLVAPGRYGRPVVHGMLTASLLSTTNGLLLGVPGGISVEQTLRFLRPVFVGDTITASTEVVEILAEQRRLRCRTTCVNQHGDVVIAGQAIEQKDPS